MNWIANIKVIHKLALGFGLCLLVCVAAGGIIVSKMGNLYDAGQSMQAESVSGVGALAGIIENVKQYRIWQLRYGLERDAAGWSPLENNLADYEKKTNGSIATYERNAKDPTDLANITQLKSSWNSMVASTAAIKAVASSKNDLKIRKVEAVDSYNCYFAVQSILNQMDRWHSDKSAGLYGNLMKCYAQAKLWALFCYAAAVLIGVLVAIVIAKSIIAPLRASKDAINALASVGIVNISRVVEALAEGNLTLTVPAKVKNVDVKGRDEAWEVVKSINGLTESLRRMVRQIHTSQNSLGQLIYTVKQGSETIHNSSVQLAEGNHDLATRTTEQASSLEETASSMEQITGIVEQSAYRAKEANTLAANAKNVAEEGGNVVLQAVRSMAEINEASKKISDIINVIDEIAFQTNLLALNAAVEAARVGEQGKGFAVVAAEVRNLATRSSEAAKEIKSLVGDSVSKVKEGADLVNKSGSQLRDIVASVNKVAVIVAEISNAAQEQTIGIEQVNKAVMQMDQITQQNAALVEETAAASDNVSNLSSDLHSIVKKFKVDLNAQSAGASSYVQEVGKLQQVVGSSVGQAAVHRRHAASPKPELEIKEFTKAEELEF